MIRYTTQTDVTLVYPHILPLNNYTFLEIYAVKTILYVMTKINFCPHFLIFNLVLKKKSFGNEYVHKNSLRHQKFRESRQRERHIQTRMTFYARAFYICCVIRLNVATTYLHVILLAKNIINFIRAQRLSWLGHVERVQGTRMVKAIYCWYPISSRPTGRPKTRWMDDIRKDKQKLKVPNWKNLTQDRRGWKEKLVEKAKTL